MNQTEGFSEEELKLSQYATLTSSQAVNQLESHFDSPDSKEISLFAPNHYQTAGKALEDAQKLLSQNGSRDKIVEKVAVGNAILYNGNRVVKQVKDNLSNELTLKEKLDALNTDNVYRSEYGGLLDRLNNVIQKVEVGKTDEVTESREKLIKDMQRLEQKARRYNAMHEPEEILKRVKYSGGEKLAPLTFNEALEVFKRADDFIKQNPTYEGGIEQVGKEALFAAKRALYITQEVAALTQKVNIAPEQVVLDEEYRMRRIARELNDDDFRDHPIEVQSELLADAAKSHAKELKNKDDLVIALRDTLIKVRDSSTELSGLADENQQLKTEKDSWLAKDALYRSKIEDLETKLNESIAQLDLTQQKLLNASNDKDALSQQLASASTQLEQVQTEVKSSETANTQQLQEQLASNQTLKTEITQWQQKDKTNQEKIALLESQLTTMQSDSTKSQQSLTDLNTQLSAAQSELEQLRLVASNSEKTADQQLQEQAAKLSALSQENTKLQTENKNQQEKLAQLEKQLAETNAQIAQTNLDIGNTAADKAFLTIELENNKQQIEALNQKLAAVNNELSETQKQLQSTQQSVASNTEWQKEKEQLLAKDKANNDSINLLKQQLAEANTKLQQTNQDLAALNTRNQQLALELETSKKASADLNQQIADARTSAKAAKESSRVTEAETLQALQSARELIQELKTNETAASASQSDTFGSSTALGED
ncbi:MAG: hypothetical protein R3240_05710, partial [Gammaproteobacteria bacterium]|nr:hypothetical protein [Gammaproteobacteria bacterium]